MTNRSRVVGKLLVSDWLNVLHLVGFKMAGFWAEFSNTAIACTSISSEFDFSFHTSGMKKEWKPGDSLKWRSETWNRILFRLKTSTKISSHTCKCSKKLIHGGRQLLQPTDLPLTCGFITSNPEYKGGQNSLLWDVYCRCYDVMTILQSYDNFHSNCCKDIQQCCFTRT